MKVFSSVWLKLLKNFLKTSIIHTELKEDNGKTNKTLGSTDYGVCEGSPVEVQWAVRWVEEDLWWEEL